ncbi:hypothetical protein NPIL_470541 [Nephila pilipes]|uniref:Uncharacterized protein n=1 Tax=Nephila pilipes TaxID=299642 RepID=A0A8X6QKI9_NEPPI|nr:hypothetical protein NPIL_470541 [Nephila pilipes]
MEQRLEFANDVVGRIGNSFDVIKFGLDMQPIFISMATTTSKIDAFRGQKTLILKSNIHCKPCVSLSGGRCQSKK